LSFLSLENFTTVGGVIAGGIIIFIVGIVDDMLSLNPWIKLAGQIVAASVLVLSGMHIELFVLSNVWISAAITIFWVVLITNSMNLLDNMDGLSAGVAVAAAFSFFLSVQPDMDGQLVRFMLMVFAGAMCGFLYHNFNPAKIFMGDSGALFSGYFLATVAVLGTYHVEGSQSRIAVAAPLFALSVPLFDTFSVMYIRWRRGQSIMLGDKRHFSHRLVDLGMSERQAVEFIYLVAGVIGLGGALLSTLDSWSTILVLVQSGGVFLLIVLLMNAGKNAERRKRGD
jgi:UDP-GlcNAc:undecaprenyl-phosphate GlcNAc-1-phosphate transferase